MQKNYNGDLAIEFEKDDSFWLSVNVPSQDEPVKVRLDVRLLPEIDAKAQKVGEARLEPNNSPFLPKPEGRVEFSTNPMKMWSQMFGSEFRAMICKNLCMIVCVFLLIMMLPMLLSQLTVAAFKELFGLI